MNETAKHLNLKNVKYDWVSTRELSIVWDSAQQGFKPDWAQKIADNMDPDKFGVIIVTLRTHTGIRHIIDGQHRVAAVRIFAGDDQQVFCAIIQTTDPTVAAKIFLGMNRDHRTVSTVDNFRVGVRAEEVGPVEINQLVQALGYQINNQPKDGAIRAVSALKTVYHRHGLAGLRDALLVLQGIWGMDKDSLDGNLIKGFSGFLAKHGDELDRQRLVDRVTKEYSPHRLLGAARIAAEMFHGNVVDNISRVLVNTYNQGLRAKSKLPE